MADVKTFRPIDWDPNAGTGWFNTAYSDNMRNAGTAMFYGASFEAAGWLAVFKNTESTTVKITKVSGLIGTRQSNNVKAKVVCKTLGTSFTNKTAIINTENSYVTNISNSIPKEDKLSTITTVSLSKALEVKSGEYFCIGFLGTDIPSKQYFNMALRRLSSSVNNIFYAQDADTSKTVTWYRSGNANDNTNWKKQYAYIWAEGEVEAEKAVNPPVIKEPDPPPAPYEKSISLNVSTKSVTIPQDSETTVTVTTGVTVVNDDPTGKIKKPAWEIVSVNHTGFTVTKKDANTISIKSTKYDNKDLTTSIKVKATSTNGTGATLEQTIDVTATHPTINTLTVTKDVLRPTETSQISCTYSNNAGGVKYSLQEIKDNNVLVASLNGSVISAGNRTTRGDKTVQLTATTVNGKVTKSINLICTNWSSSDLQVALSSNVMFTDTLFADSSDRISIINESLYGLKVNYSLKANTVLSFSNTFTDLNKKNVESKATTLLYSYGNEKQNVIDTLTACLSCDTAVTKSFNITLKAPPSAELNYPLGITTGGTPTINLPAIARKNGSKWDVYYSTYPIQINIKNDNASAIKVTIIPDKGPTMKIGSAFDKTILSGAYWIRPECDVTQYSTLPNSNVITYTLTVSHQELSGSYTNIFEKKYKINYTIYDELSDVISKNDQGTEMTAIKAERTLNLARGILSQYITVNIPSIAKYDYILNSKSSLSTALNGLSNLIDNINQNSASLIIMPQHRTTIADGNYIMADDSVATLADGRANTIKDNHLNLSNPTASPFREIVKAVYNLTGPIEHYTINYKSGSKSYNISKINGTSINSLYL